MGKQVCPLIRRACTEHQCAWYTHLIGQNPQSGDPVDTWGCAMTVLPILLVENSNHSRETVARVDQFRELATQVVRSNALRQPTDELKRLIGVTDG